MLTVNSAAGIQKGFRLTVAGVSGVMKVISVSGTSITLDINASATVTNAVVAYSAPVFASYGNMN